MTKPFPAVIPPDVQVRFWAEVDARGPDECWEWQGALTAKGYARPHLPCPRSVSAHRFADYLKNGEARDRRRNKPTEERTQ